MKTTMETIKQFYAFLKTGWWLIAWVMFLGYTCFWSLIILGMFGICGTPLVLRPLFVFVVFGVSIFSALATIFLLFIIISDENKD